MKFLLWLIVGLVCMPTLANNSANNRSDFIRQQAYAEMQRISGQVDVLQANLDEVVAKVNSIERTKRELEALKAENAALRASLEQLRLKMETQREEIVKDLSKRLAKFQQETIPQVKNKVETAAIEYVVKGGDTLTLIAQAFNTKIATIKEMNNLKSDALKIGQKLKLPEESKK